MNCPWNSFKPSEIDFCEENLCSWIVEPASTYSCVFYIIAGILIIISAKSKSFIHQSFGWMVVLIGLFSICYHATLAFWGSILDLASMYLLGTTFVYINLSRFRNLTSISFNKSAIIFYIIFNILLLIFTFLYEKSTGILYLILMLSVLGMETYHYFSKNNKINYKWIFYALCCYVSASFFWYWDTYRVFCDPFDHIVNGHVIWHLGSAAAAYCMYKYYYQFELK